MHSRLSVFCTVAIIISLDQLSKYIANSKLVFGVPVNVFPGFNCTLLYNKGAAFSFLADSSGWQRWFFIFISIAISIIIIYWLYRLTCKEYLERWGLTAILGGAIGNLIDRLYHGFVIDFIQIYYSKWYWPVFNIADSAITVGIIFLILSSFSRKNC